MPWFKVDDALAFHMKAITAGNQALGLWVRAGSWSMHQLSDGFVPAPIVFALGGTDDDCTALVSAGLWDVAPGGYQFHDWAEYQPTREQVLAERAAAAERQRRSRESRRDKPRDGDGTDAVSSPSPSRPVPSRPEGLTLTTESSPEVDANASTDAEVSQVGKTLAARAGITDVDAIRAHILACTGRELDADRTVTVARWLCGKSKDPAGPKNPQQYAMRAVTLSPLEVQQYIDERGLAA